MPEGPEIRIMSNFVNEKVKNKVFKKCFFVEKGNNAIDSKLIENFKLKSSYRGKQIFLELDNDQSKIDISIFMGMSGNWKFINTDEFNQTKYIRLRFDTNDRNSLILHGPYMGPKYRVGKFVGVDRSPDIVNEFEKFKENVISNLDSRVFNKPICEALLDQKYFNGVGAYLNSEIVGRLDLNPMRKFNTLTTIELANLFDMIIKCYVEAYNAGGGELKDWTNPFGKSQIGSWLRFYGRKDICYKQKFGTRNIWIQSKFKPN